MEEDDDDLYEPGDAVPAQTQNGTTQQASDAQDGEEVEEVEVEVEDDDVRSLLSYIYGIDG